jgi:hypothetical protein
LILFTGRSVQFMAVGTLAMENRSAFAAAQQLFADATPALVANVQHKQKSFSNDFARVYAEQQPCRLPRWVPTS